MKTEELRIGNLIKWSGNIHKVNHAQENGYVFFQKKNLQGVVKHISEIDPIIINEELLVKLGFYRFKGWDDMLFYRHKSFNHDTLFDFELLITEQGYETPEGNIIKYAHILQNVFYYYNLNFKELKLIK